MRDLKNVYRRYALSFATASLAICIGFVMQSSEAAVLPTEAVEGGSPSVSQGHSAQIGFQKLAGIDSLPDMPKEQNLAAPLPTAPVLVAVADDIPVGLLPSEEAAPMMGCVPTAAATPAAGALVALTVEAACHANEPVVIEHESLSFRALMPEHGLLQLEVPALAESAFVSVTFGNGDTIQSSTIVDSLAFYDRVLLQWDAPNGAELHAREFGADYGSDGHVWREMPRDVSALVGGSGGFIMNLGRDDVPGATRAEIYTFPSGISGQSGDVAISVELEVTAENCGQHLKLRSSALRQGQLADRHALSLQVPDCSAVGEFLVLKNLVEDLTIAQK